MQNVGRTNKYAGVPTIQAPFELRTEKMSQSRSNKQYARKSDNAG